MIRFPTTGARPLARESLLALAAALWLAVPRAAGAADPDAPADDAAPEISLVERQHQRISGALEAMLRRTDTLFGGDRNYDLPTGSYVRLGARGTFYRPDDRGNDLSGILSAKLRLPRTQDRLQIVLQQEIENVLLSPSQREAQAEATGTAGEEINQYLGLRGVAVEKLKLQLHGDVGMKVNVPLDPYARLRMRRLFKAGDWYPTIAETLLWRHSQGTSATTEFALLRPYGTTSALSLITSATWRDRKDGFDLGQTATYTHRINPRSLAAAEVGVLGESRPNLRSTVYYASLRYRRKLYSEWLLFEVRPQLTYPRDREFQPIPSITLQIEAYFGQNYLDKL